MKFVVVGYGSRGDVEPCAAAALELVRRGHDVSMAAPPNLLGFIESAGLAAVAYGPDSREEMNPGKDLVRTIAAHLNNPLSVVPDVVEHVTQVKVEKGATLTQLARGADLIVTSFNEQGVAANVAEYYGIAVAALHPFPEQVWSSDQLFSHMTKVAEDAQRRTLGLPEATGPATLSLEIQAYDANCVPKLAAEWADQAEQRPFVGALTLELATEADKEVLSWIAEGTAPIYFGFGSTPLSTPAETFGMIIAACAELGERLLICTGPNDVSGDPHPDHVKVVEAANHAAIFPACRTVVHHGGAGTVAAALRAGIPNLILWLWLDQPLWATAVRQLEVGFGRRFSEATLETLVADLRVILSPQYATRAREIAPYIVKPAVSLEWTADLLEHTARRGRQA